MIFTPCRLLGAASLLACAACSGEDAPSAVDPSGAGSSSPDARERSGEASPYAFLRGAGIVEQDMPALWAALPYDSISLTREGCFGTCPIYQVTFRRGIGIGEGSARYSGEAYVDRQGEHDGGIDLWTYARLCELFDSLEFLDLRASYAAEWTDDETVIVEVSTASGAHQVLDYGHQGPPELVALQLAVEAISERIEWAPGGGADLTP